MAAEGGSGQARMVTMIAAAWRVVLKRTLSDWLILGAAFVTILLATTLLSAGPIYAGAVTLSGVQRTLNDADVRAANVQIATRTRGNNWNELDAAATANAARALSPTGGPIFRGGRSESFALPGQDPAAVRDLTVFAFFERLAEHAALVAGAWPASSAAGPVEVAVPEPTANLLNYRIDDRFTVESRREPGRFVDVRIVGIYRVNNPSDPYWWNDPLDIEGVAVGQSFTTYGPLVTTPDVFLGRLSTSSSSVFWRVYPVVENLGVSDVPVLRRNVEGLEGVLNVGRGPNDRFSVETDLDGILRRAERSLLVTRSGVLVLTMQLAILAVYALVLTAGLLIEQRRVETALLRSRGADSGQVGMMALMEALALALPAALLGPWVAAFALRALNVIGPLAAIRLSLDPRIGRDAYGLALISALGCTIALVYPAVRSARTYAEARTDRGRQAGQSLAQRAGIDLMLLAVAVLAYWQLRRYGAPITETVQGRLGLDPFLIAAPAIGLLAGAIVALRVVPLLARLVERSANRRAGIVSALGAWQLARRPLRYARSALLLMLALAIGLFAVSYTRTWTLSQQDQADYQTGADLRVRPDRRIGASIPSLDLASAQLQLDGVERTMAVSQDTVQVSRSAGSGALLALDAAQANAIVAFRPDLANASLTALMEPLAAARPTLATVPLPGEPQRLALDVRLELDPLPAELPANYSGSIAPTIDLVMQDATGMLYTVRAGGLADDGSEARLIVPLAYQLADRPLALPRYPLALVAIELRVFPPARVARAGRLIVSGLSASPALAGENWASVALNGSPQGWTTKSTELVSAFSAPAVTDTVLGPATLTIAFNSGSVANSDVVLPVTFTTTPGASQLPEAIPALASDRFLAVTETKVGDVLPVDVGRERRDVRIVGALRGFPTLDPLNASAIVVDLPTLSMIEYTASGALSEPKEWWVAVAPGRGSAVADALRDAPYTSARVFDREALGRTLRTDPVALGIIGALSLGFVAATLFAIIGFAVSAAVSSHERLTEFALLRALGLSTGQLTNWLSIENGLLVGLSVLGGTGLGLALAWLVLPLVSLTQEATRVFPGVRVIIPWGAIVLLEGALLASLGLVVGALVWALRRVGLGSALRLGEER